MSTDELFGIISTGAYWEGALSKGVASMGDSVVSRFAGVTTTGLTAIELHDRPADEVKLRMKEATRQLLRKGRIGAVCLGCAGMTGLDEVVREASNEELGDEAAARLSIVDGVAAALSLVVSSFNE